MRKSCIREAVRKIADHALVVGACQHAGAFEIASYVQNQADIASGCHGFDDEIELFITEFDEGRFFRSFLLPTDFRNLVASMISEFEIASSVRADRPIFIIHQLELNENSRTQEFTQLFEESAIESNVRASVLTLIFRKYLDIRSEYRDLAWLYKTASHFDVKYLSVEYDLR